MLFLIRHVFFYHQSLHCVLNEVVIFDGITAVSRLLTKKCLSKINVLDTLQKLNNLANRKCGHCFQLNGLIYGTCGINCKL